MNDPTIRNTDWYDKALKFIEEGRNDNLRPQLGQFNLTINELPFIVECLKNKSNREKEAEQEVRNIFSPVESLLGWLAIPTFFGLVSLLIFSLMKFFYWLIGLIFSQVPETIFAISSVFLFFMSLGGAIVILSELSKIITSTKVKIIEIKIKRKLHPYHDSLMLSSQMKKNLDEFIVANEKYENDQKARIEAIRREELVVLQKQKEAKLVELRKQKEFWKELSGLEFEDEVEKIFIKLGYKTLRTKLSNDGGYDIVIEKDGKRYIVECKHHRKPIGVTVLRALHGVKGSANGCILVSLNGCSKTANEFAVQNEIQILDMNRLISLSKGLG